MAMMESDEFTAVIEELLQIAPKTNKSIINPRSHLEIDIGLDSLDRLELLNLLEKRFSLSIQEDVFDKMETMADIISLVRESRAHPANTSVENTLGLKERILSDTSYEFPSELKTEPALFPALAQRFINKSYRVPANNLLQFFPQAHPCVFAANHIHPADILYIIATLPPEVRKHTVFLGDRETKSYPKFPYSFYKAQMVPLEKDDDTLEMIRVSLGLLRSGRNLIIFPEGIISEPPVVAPFKSAVGLLLRETEIPVVPVRILATESGKTSLRFGKPVSCRDMVDQKIISDVHCPAEEIAAAVRQMVVDLPSP